MLVAIYGKYTIFKLLIETTDHTIESFVHFTSATGQEKKAFVMFSKQERAFALGMDLSFRNNGVCNPQKFWVAGCTTMKDAEVQQPC